MATSLALFQVVLVYFSFSTIVAYASDETAASKFKAPNLNTPDEVVSLWKEKDEALWKYVEDNVPAVLEHTGHAAFDEHLRGVQSVLRFWGAPEHLTAAGLFHSIYGTEGFQGFALPLSERETIQKMIGPEAEKLCFIFCMVDRSTVDQTVFDWDPDASDEPAQFTFTARPELGRFKIELNKEEWLDFIELTLADWLEQVEGAAKVSSDIFLWKTGEAYAYRRLAYQKMSELLAIQRSPRLKNVAPAMLEAVMATESVDTRHLVQARTPPMSKAAEDALRALRAVGEGIPEDLSPQPISTQCESKI
mmetsp:Transcript_8121/g.11702  ORF Transcript_8121/g.11702 Transcript_8121/m.11702 type:complete len:306 (-) Transcript_8121:622-1539(-)